MTKTDEQFKLECDPSNAPTFYEWVKNRGGVARWKSVNLSNPGASWCAPANDKDGKQYDTKPNWQCDGKPEIIVTNPDEIGVYESAQFKAFPVALKRHGMSLHLTDASQRKVDKAMNACREKYGDAFYRKGVLDIDGASMGIYYTTGIISLTQWIEKNGPGNPAIFD